MLELYRRRFEWAPFLSKPSVLVRALFFCQYRIFEQIGTHPLAARLTHNLIHLAAGYLG
jgi:hypothetical protein